jgi:hypothetical protein
MPTPLFPFTWQYNNQPIEVLADNIAEVIVNTSKVIPVSDGLTFVDSTLTDTGASLQTTYLSAPNTYEEKGFILDYAGGKYKFGDYAADDNGSTLDINDGAQILRMITKSGAGPAVTYFALDGLNNTLTADDSLTATTAGAAAAKFLKIKIGATDYKIQLLAV